MKQTTQRLDKESTHLKCIMTLHIIFYHKRDTKSIVQTRQTKKEATLKKKKKLPEKHWQNGEYRPFVDQTMTKKTISSLPSAGNSVNAHLHNLHQITYKFFNSVVISDYSNNLCF